MLYLLVWIGHYRQLARIDQELARSIEDGIRDLGVRHGVPPEVLRDGNALFALGPEDQADPRRALEMAFLLHSTLEERKEELYGYQLLLAVVREASGEAALRQLKDLLAGCEEEGELWIDADAGELFTPLVETRRTRELYRVLSRALPREAPREVRQARWVQERLVFQGFQALNQQLERKDGHLGLYLYGPVSQDRRSIVDALQERLAGTAAVRRFPRLYALFERRSTLHPFLNSVDPAFLPHVEKYLESHERAAWAELGDLLGYLRPGAPAGGGGGRRAPRRGRQPLGEARRTRRREADKPAGERAPARREGPLARRGRREGAPEAQAAGGERAPGPALELWPDHLAEDFLLVLPALPERVLPPAGGKLPPRRADLRGPGCLPALHHAAPVDTAEGLRQPELLPARLHLRREGAAGGPRRAESRAVVRPAPAPGGDGAPGLRAFPGPARCPERTGSLIRLAVRGKPVTFQHCLLYLQRKGLILREGEQYRWQAAEDWDRSCRSGR